MRKPVQVLQILSELQLGGTEKSVIELLKASQGLPNIQFVSVVLNDVVDPRMVEEISQLNYPVYFLKKPEGQQHPRYLFKLLKIILKHKIQVIHAHNYGAKFWSVLCKAVFPNLKLVFTIHDTHYHFSQKDLWLHRYLFSAHIAISKAVKSECETYRLRNIQQIYHGVHLKKFASKRSQQTLPKKKPTFKVIQIARLQHEKKGQDILLQAVKYCIGAGIPIECYLVGNDRSDTTSIPFLQKMVQDLNIENAVHFLGDRTDIPECLQSSDLFILPSRYEGFGLVVVEAMASCMPVIVSNIDGPAELIRDHHNGLLFESGNAYDLFEKIKYCYLNPETAQRLACQSEKDAALFDITRVAKTYAALYQGLVYSEKERYRHIHEQSLETINR